MRTLGPKDTSTGIQNLMSGQRCLHERTVHERQLPYAQLLLGIGSLGWLAHLVIEAASAGIFEPSAIPGLRATLVSRASD